MVLCNMIINWDKTNYLVKEEKKLVISPVLEDGIEVKRVQEVKYLGFHRNDKFESLQYLQLKKQTLTHRSYSLYNTEFFSIGLKVDNSYLRA
jgi:hypothetical protein